VSALVFEGDVAVFVQPSDVMVLDEYVSGFAGDSGGGGEFDC
jgi:hypothetical protein